MIFRRPCRYLVAALFSFVAVAGSALASDIAGQATIIDGDTIEIHGQRIRLFGIDAPESRQTCEADGEEYRCGKDAAFALADKIGRQTVSCDKRGRNYDRIVAVCYTGGEDVGTWLVEQGWARAYRKYSVDYVDEEARAKAAKRGIWQGTFTDPWEWRKNH